MIKRLLLLGGGHTHVEILRRFGTAPPRDTHLVLVSPERHMPYSGMLPGFVAGHYDFHDCHIDLAPLCRFARAEFHAAQARGIDAVANRVLCAGGAAIEYDVLSIDIGSTPEAGSIPGALEHATCVKPVAAFVITWDRIRRAASAGDRAPSIAVVGGGAGGIELALAMHFRLRAERPVGAPALTFHLLTDTASILPAHPPKVRRIFERVCSERGIAVHTGSKVTKIEPGLLHRENAAPLNADYIILATAASVPSWLGASGLKTDAQGFVAVNGALQSVSHPNVFAAGDIASMVGHPRPKSGVFAVRQGPPLAGNLRRKLAGRPLAAYAPQKVALALISTGDRYAVASWGRVAFEGKWVWRWKDYIDRRFMAAYRVHSCNEHAA